MKRLLPLVDALDRHCAALSACTKCARHNPDVLPILSESRAPTAMLVGQAPGKVEIHDQRAFAGRAGKTLFKWLASAGIDEATAREHIFISAITRCYPGPSPSGRGDRVPSLPEREECSVWLDAELDIIRPKLLIPVGKLAIGRFLGPLPLAQVIGRVHRVRHAGGSAECIPLPHPSGASSWIHAPGHGALLEKALAALRVAFKDLGRIARSSHTSRRTA